MPKFTLQQLYQLYKDDTMVLHSMPTSLIDERPGKMDCKSSLMSGSLMFFGGLQHENGHHVPNAVARFGDDAHDTLFATVHDLDAVFDTHEALEQQKPEDKRGTPFVLFANSDIGNLTKDKEQCPPKDYLEAQWGVCPPLQCERPRGFDFRKFCSTKDEKEDPSMEAEGAEWNEMRAVLNTDNMVGLLYIHDPQFSPQQHADLAKKLCNNFGGKLEIGVLKMNEPGGHQGDLLLVDSSGSGSSGAKANPSKDAKTDDKANAKADGKTETPAAGTDGAVDGTADEVADAADANGGDAAEATADGAAQEQEGDEQQQKEEGEVEDQQSAKRQKLGEEVAGSCRATADAPEGKKVDEPPSCRLLTFWEYLEQCK